MSGWKPIETAPRDETWVLLYFPDGHWLADGCKVALGFWNTGDDPDWYAHECDSKPLSAFESVPTHWMDIPAEPGEKGEAA